MTQLEQFIKDKKEESEKKSPKLDVIKRIAYFQKLVEDFYSKVEKDWLADVWNDIHHDYVQLNITEEQLGTYTVQKLILSFGDEVISFNPIGTILLGASGRIDIQCGRNTVMCVYVGENIKRASDAIQIRFAGEKPPKRKGPGQPVWKFASRMGKFELETINKESFQRKFMEIVNGTY